MKRILIIVDHYPVSPRVLKMINSLEKQEYKVMVAAWNRSEYKYEDKNNIFICNLNTGYGNRLKKFIGLFFFKYWLDKTIIKLKPDILHAIDFEMLCLIRNKNLFKVYEIYDIKSFNNKFLNYLREILEFNGLKKADLIIMASPFFNYYYELDDKFIVINNKPNEVYIKNSEEIEKKRQSNDIIKIGFIGTVRYFRTLIPIISIMKLYIHKYEFHIYGSGPDLDKIKDFVKKESLTNVIIHGRFDSRELYNIYSSIDIVWACYPPEDKNVKFAVSNKFYESQYFGKNVIVSKETYLGQYVYDNNLGYVVNPYDEDELILLLNDLIKTKVTKKRSAKNDSNYTWESEEYLIKNNYLF